ncbi:hypothetical protein WDU94_003090 [Cyamophila willieti]
MRAHWETSEKSIYIRTVWINGVRHAILSKNDPLLKTNNVVPKRPHSCGNVIEPVKRRNKKRLSNNPGYNRSLSMCTTSSSNEVSTGIDSLESPSDVEYEYRFNSEYRFVNENNGEGDSNSRKREEEERSGKYKKIKLPNLNMKSSHVHSNVSHDFSSSHANTSETQTNYNYYLKNNFINPITERVLNWLDLASKETISGGFGDPMADLNGSTDDLVDENNENDGDNESGNSRGRNGNVVLARISGEPSSNYQGNRTSADTFSNSLDIINNQGKYVEQNQYNQSSERDKHTETIGDSNKYQETMGNSWSKHQDRNNTTAHVGNNAQTSSRPHKIIVNDYKGHDVETSRNSSQSRQKYGSEQQQRTSKLIEEMKEGFYRLPATTPQPKNGASNFTFNFQTISNATKNGTDKCASKSNPYGKNIRTNNELIRRNNENISKLVQNIDTFKRTNEIQAGNNTSSRTHKETHNSDRVYKTHSYNINNNNTNNDKSSMELGTKSRYKKGHRKSRSNGRRYYSSQNDGARVTGDQTDDEEYATDEDINDTFRYTSVLTETNTNNILLNSSLTNNNYELTRKYSILDDHHPTRKFSIDQQQCIIRMNQQYWLRAIPGRSQDGTHCRRCPPPIETKPTETLGHVLGSCPFGHLARLNRHNTIRSIIATELKKQYEVYEEVPSIASDGSSRRIDIIAIDRKNKKGVIVGGPHCTL